MIEAAALARRAVASAFIIGLALVSSGTGCNDRFEFDVMVAGSGGSSAQAGASSSGAGAGGGGTGSAGSGGGGVSGGGSFSAGNGGSGALGGGGGETPDPGCGEGGACPADLHCADDMCWQCAQDTDCATYSLPRCEPTRHRCVSCVSTADCETGFACDSLANRCLKKCSGDSDCKGQHGCDERRQVCYQCDENRECQASPLGNLCASDRSGCVQCLADSDCPGQHCDQLVGRCVECRDGADCASRLCSPTSFTCLAP